ncbi:hypothetical protein JB92DRAFT_2922037, partial [Gautieria morchelliformis]
MASKVGEAAGMRIICVAIPPPILGRDSKGENRFGLGTRNITSTQTDSKSVAAGAVRHPVYILLICRPVNWHLNIGAGISA